MEVLLKKDFLGALQNALDFEKGWDMQVDEEKDFLRARLVRKNQSSLQ